MKQNSISIIKYPEKDGIIVYTPTATWSSERKEEGKLREWMPLNDKGEKA